MSLGIFRISAPNKNHEALASNPEKKDASQASGLRLLKAINIGAWENPRRWWENLPMITKREDPLVSSKLAGLLWKKNIPVYMR